MLHQGRQTRTLLMLILILVIAVPAITPTPGYAQEQARPTLRVHGYDGRTEGAGAVSLADSVTDALPEDPPYTDETSIFSPVGAETPRKDFVTWNPAWMYEHETLDENQRRGLYDQLYADGLNISEKVWFRFWYEPSHGDKDGVFYPAIMEEFTYMLMEADFLANEPAPTAGPAGRTQFVFPVGLRSASMDAPYGYGLTTFDADFDCTPDIVQIHSEATIGTELGVTMDFNQNGTADPLDPNGIALTGDEIVVLSLAPKEVVINGAIQFLDHALVVENVTDSGATMRIFYTGDRLPVDMGSQSMAVGDVWTYRTRMPGVSLSSPQPGEIPGPFFVHLDDVDSATGHARLRIGRALGAADAAVQGGEPRASLKRFYVDGHEYNVVGVGTSGQSFFRYITIRTPVPKEDITIKQHSIHLQGYSSEDWLSVMPPFNHEHYVIKDVQREQSGRIIGDLMGPMPPILQNPDELPYHGECPLEPEICYGNANEMRFSYTREDINPQYMGQLLEIYTEEESGDSYRETWRAHKWQTTPYQFTEFLLPDVATQEDLYLLTSAFFAPQAIVDQELMGARVQFWFDPAESDAKYKWPDWLRVFGEDSFGPGNIKATDPLLPNAPVEALPYTNPFAPFDPQDQEAPVKDSVTFNPAFMSEFQSKGEMLQSILYPRISIAGHDALEKVWFRQWYEPEHLNKVLRGTRSTAYQEFYAFPAVMQEFTYMFLDTYDQPTWAAAGDGILAFPIGATMEELEAPFGFGLTTFDADFDGANDDVVRVHSEQTLARSTGISADFDGDGVLDEFDSTPNMNGDELIVFAVENLTLTPDSPTAIFLDHMVELLSVTPAQTAQLQIWNTGGGLDTQSGGDFAIVPHRLDGAQTYSAGTMAIVGRNKVNVKMLPAGTDNLGEVDGAWFVYVNDVNSRSDVVNVTIGRALGATHSAIDNGNGQHDLMPGDPWYLKRFFVDGHEYNVVAVYTPVIDYDANQMPIFGFKYISIRTPVPKENFVNRQDSQKLEGYEVGRTISVMPPFNSEHTIAEDILPDHRDDHDKIGELILRPPLEITILEEAVEPEFFGELKEVCAVTDSGQRPLIQLGMALDSSGSIGAANWQTIVDGVASAVADADCLPQDGRVELTVASFSSDAELIVPPTVVDAGSVVTVADAIRNAGFLNSNTNMADAINMIATEMVNSVNFTSDAKQVLNLATDGNPNVGNPDGFAAATAARESMILQLAMTEAQDEIDVEAIGSAVNMAYLQGSMAFPQPGYVVSDPADITDPGWVLQVADAQAFADSVCTKLRVNVSQSCTWTNHAFHTRPDHYTAFGLPEGELYLLTSSWLDETGNRVKFWFNPGESLDLFVNTFAVEAPEDLCDLPADPPVCHPLNPADPIDPPDPPPGAQAIHIVRPGDSVQKIAEQYGVTAEAICSVNRLPDPCVIYVGQHLIIP